MGSGLSDAILGLSPAEYDVFKLALLALLIYLFWRIQRHYRQMRLLADTPSSRIASAAQGQVELEGLAEWMRGDRLLSPFSGERCVWYRCRIERRQKLHYHSRWIEDRLEVSDHPFRLVDDSGECIIDPDGAEVIARHSRSWYGDRIEQRVQPTRASIVPGLLFNPRYRFTEQLIRVADPIHVTGRFETQHHYLDIEDEDRRVEEIVAEWKKHPARYLKDFDLDGDRRISGIEWTAVRDRARQQLRDALGPAVHVLRKPDADHGPFVISAHDEPAMQRRHLRAILWSLMGFILLLYLLLFAATLRPW